MRRIALCVAPLVFLMASSAVAADLSDPAEQASGARLGLDPAGTTYVSWSVTPGGNSALGRVARRAPEGDAFTTQKLLPINGGDRSDVRVLAVGDGGDAAVLTQSTNGASPRVQVAVRRPGDFKFGQFQDVSAAGQIGGDGDLVITPEGEVVAVWQHKTASNQPPVVQTASLKRGAASFSMPVTLSAPAGVGNADLDVDAAVSAGGDVAVAWTLPDGTGTKTLQVATRARTEDFGIAKSVSVSPGSAVGPSIALDAAGVPTVAWTQLGHYPMEATGALQVSSRSTPSGPFDPPQTLTESGTDGDDPDLATDGAGRTTLVYTLDFPVAVGPRAWRAPMPAPQQVHVATRAAGAAAFSAPVQLSANADGDATEPEVVAAPGGNVAVTWVSRFETVHLARRSAGAPDFNLQTFDTGGKARFPQMGIGPDGDSTIVWMGYDDDGGIVRIGNLDTTAPFVDAITVPEAVPVDTDAAMSVTGHDRLSPVAASWDFGDGQTASGFDVSHRYANPGSFTVTGTITDAVGNSARATRTIVVTAAAPSPTPTPTSSPVPTPQPGARPKLSSVSLSRKRVRAARKGAAFAKQRRKRTGFTLSFRSSAAGTLELTIARQPKGRHLALPAKRVEAGKHRLILTARRKGRRLEPGRYRLRLVLVNAAGRSRPVTRTVRVIR